MLLLPIPLSLFHPLLPFPPHDDGSAVVRLCSRESLGKDGRGFGADGGANGHEEAGRPVSMNREARESWQQTQR